jgi:hypothetical protein
MSAAVAIGAAASQAATLLRGHLEPPAGIFEQAGPPIRGHLQETAIVVSQLLLLGRGHGLESHIVSLQSPAVLGRESSILGIVFHNPGSILRRHIA